MNHKHYYFRILCLALFTLLLQLPASGQSATPQDDCALWSAFINNKRVRKDFARINQPQVLTVTPAELKDCPASADTSVFVIDNAFKRASAPRLYLDMSYQEENDLYVVNLHPVVAVAVWAYRFRKTKKGYRLVSHAMSMSR